MNFLKSKKFLFIVLILIIILFVADKKDASTSKPNDTTNEVGAKWKHIVKNPKVRGNRVLGMSVTEGGIGFEKAFPIAQGVGVEVIELPVPWDEYEPEVRKYESNWLSVADGYYPKVGTKISLSLNPIDTNNLRLPKDLRGKAFNDPEVIERYKSFVDFVASQVINSDIFFVAIGNEIDIYLGNSKNKWQEYTEFYNAVMPYVKEKFPNSIISSKITFEGIMDLTDKSKFIVDNSDAILVNYYPFKKGTFIVREPGTVLTDFKQITDLYPNKKIYFAEIGYPSGALNESSETKQAEFMSNAFAAWDMYATNIPFLNFVWLHDKSPESVAEFQRYYGIKDKSFASYLGSLGLRTFDGKDKQAFTELKTSIKDRKW